MAFHKNPETEKEVFVLKLPLRHEPWQRDILDNLFQACNYCKNALIKRKLNAWKQLSETRRWRYIQTQLKALYTKCTEEKNADTEKRLKELYTLRNAVLQEYQFSKYAFEHEMITIYKHFGKKIHVHVAQKLADDVWDAFEDLLYGKGKDVSFSRIDDFKTIEAKSPFSGLVYDDGFLYLGGKTRYRLKLPVCLNRCDAYGYEEQALQRKIHFCGIERRPYPDGWHYFVVLHLGGTPPLKVCKETGELLHPLGKGRVGHDIGTQTLASVGDKDACLVVLAERTQNIENELRRVNRALDRSRRATNPEMFDAKGCIVNIDKLPDECIKLMHGKKKRNWVKSNRYRKLELLKRALYARQAECRIQQHNELANRLLSYGDEHYIEQMNFAALAKKSKKQTDLTQKPKRRKRFGKSISNKAPATFVSILQKKVLAQGGSFQKIDTFKAKASQYNHGTKAYKKKHLSQRWNDMPDGNRVQRDLYSAFCIQNTNAALNGFEQTLLESKYSNFLILHASALAAAKQKDYIPVSMGIK